MRGSLETVAIARDVASTSPSKGPSALDMTRSPGNLHSLLHLFFSSSLCVRLVAILAILLVFLCLCADRTAFLFRFTFRFWFMFVTDLSSAGAGRLCFAGRFEKNSVFECLPLFVRRCQRVSADCLRGPNGTAGGSRKPVSRSCKDDGALVIGTDSSRLASSSVEPKRARAPQPPPPPPPPPPSAAGPSQPRDQGHHPSDSSDTASPSSTGAAGSGGGVGDVLLQWGHKKRSRGRRDAAASAPAPQRRQAGAKIQRRSSAPTEKLMPPPAAAAGGSYTRGSNLRGTPSLPARGGGDGLHGRHAPHPHRSVEEKSGGQSRAEKRSPEKANKSTAEAADMNQDSKNQQNHGMSGTGNGAPAADEKVELPRIFVGLSRKEKEDDFMAMKGTKLPQRPKKRAKNVDKNLQYVFPGMWLSDLTKSRYEVREKKCVKKKRRGLKGMESMDSDSD